VSTQGVVAVATATGTAAGWSYPADIPIDVVCADITTMVDVDAIQNAANDPDKTSAAGLGGRGRPLESRQ
jgi:hypothetical protein